MSSSRLRWLLIIMIVELLIIIGLVVWVANRPDDKPDSSTTTTETDAGVLTASLVSAGFDRPVNIVVTPVASDANLYVTEQGGIIKTIKKDGTSDPATFLDISSKVKSDEPEMGLLGLAFHPDFAQNGYFFVNYIDKESFTIVSRIQVNASGQADPATEKVLLKIKQPYINHNGGPVVFGPDGYLYIALGDGGAGGDPENRAQNKGDLLGKILRLDVDKGDPYAVPETNPFATEAGTKPEIWALGLRNPWRISFDKQTGDLYIGDVGQDTIEEVSVQLANSKGGENYGWRCYEGTKTYKTDGCQDASKYVMPQFEYTHENDRCSVAGGYVYRGTKSMSLVGSYIYGDTCTGEIFSATPSGGTWSHKKHLDTPYVISTFGEDRDGELYVADHESGSIYHLTTN